ncbi:hypothetical protein ACVIJ6_007390 [Bradyrhizobium sp. USDA 4369]
MTHMVIAHSMIMTTIATVTMTVITTGRAGDRHVWC